LAAAGVPPQRLVIELVEHPVLWQNPELARNLNELRSGGVRIAVDDFGSGYSNLRHLTRLPVDMVKLDHVFLEEFDDPQQRGRALLLNMIKLCQELGYAPLAEGVETAAQDQLLRQSHCRYAQGYFYGRPVALEKLVALAPDFSPSSV